MMASYYHCSCSPRYPWGVFALLPLLPVGGRAMGEEGWGDEGSCWSPSSPGEGGAEGAGAEGGGDEGSWAGGTLRLLGVLPAPGYTPARRWPFSPPLPP